MTVEQIIAQVEAGGWIVWHLGRSTKGLWRARLADPAYNGSVREGLLENDEGWRVGQGDTLIDALSEAARDFLTQQQKDQIDLTKLLG